MPLAIISLALIWIVDPNKSIEYLIEEYSDESSRWIEINGLNVHFKAEGSGDTIILLHGTSSSIHTWDGWVNQLDDSFHVIRMDLPGFGLTGARKDRDYSIQNYVSFLDVFVKKLELGSFHLAGNSLGGHIAWAYALEYPASVDKLILVDAAGYPGESENEALAFKVAQNRFLRPIMKYITPKSFIKKNLLEVYGDDKLVTDPLVKRYHDLALRPGSRQAFIDRVLNGNE